MSDKLKKVLSVGGSVAVVGGTVAILASGGDASSVEGLIGLASMAFAAIVALINGFRK
jgi:hypothetical protein